MAALASVASIIAPAATVLAEETMTVAKAKELIANAGQVGTIYDYNVALVAIQKLPAAEQPALNAELAKFWSKCAPTEVVNVLNKMIELAAKKDLTNFYLLMDQIQKTVTNNVNKNYLLNELNSWGKAAVFTPDVVAATNAIIKAWTEKTAASVDAAKELVAKVTNAGSKTWCANEIAAVEKLVAVKVKSVAALNSKQAVVTFENEIGTAAAVNFTSDNGLTVTKAEVSATNKKEVTLTFNDTFEDKTTYAITVNGVKSVAGVELTTAATVSFEYEIKEVKSITLNKVEYNSMAGLNVLDYITIKDEAGRNITDEVTDEDSEYTVVVNTTDSDVVDGEGDIVADANKSAYVEIVVLNADDEEVATTGAVKVTVSPYYTLTFEGIHVGDESVDVDAYEELKEDGDLVAQIQLGAANEAGDDVQFLNIFAKDADGDFYKVDATDATITNLTPTVATVSESTGEFVIKTISAGTAQVKVKVGTFETTVSFKVVADAKVASGTLDKSAVTLTTTATSPSTTGTVLVTLLDQYGSKIDAGTGTFEVTTSKSGIIDAVTTPLTETSTNGVYEIPLTADANGTTTVTVKYKTSGGTTVFTKTFTVTVKDFGTAVKYDLVVASDSADYLDADVDTDEDGKDEIDNEVVFKLYHVDAAGNRVDELTLDGTDNYLKLDLVALTDAEEELVDQTTGKLAADTLTFAEADVAQTLVKNGTIKVSAVVGGVTVDSVNVSYKNSDSVATKAVVNTADLVLDIDNVADLDEILFGIYNGTKYTFSPILTIVDQFGATMKYDADSTPNLDVLSNGLTVVPTTTITNEKDLTVAADGTITFNDGKTSGSFTVVISAVETSLNEDLLAAPVAINVTVVK